MTPDTAGGRPTADSAKKTEREFLHGIRSVINRRAATAQDVKTRWSGRSSAFRCYMCGHKFAVGDFFRCAFTNDVSGTMGNPLVCDKCDGPDLKERYAAACEEARTRFWWLLLDN